MILAWADVMALDVAIVTTVFPVGFFLFLFNAAPHSSLFIGSSVPTSHAQISLCCTSAIGLEWGYPTLSFNWLFIPLLCCSVTKIG